MPAEEPYAELGRGLKAPECSRNYCPSRCTNRASLLLSRAPCPQGLVCRVLRKGISNPCSDTSGMMW